MRWTIFVDLESWSKREKDVVFLPLWIPHFLCKFSTNMRNLSKNCSSKYFRMQGQKPIWTSNFELKFFTATSTPFTGLFVLAPHPAHLIARRWRIARAARHHIPRIAEGPLSAWQRTGRGYLSRACGPTAWSAWRLRKSQGGHQGATRARCSCWWWWYMACISVRSHHHRPVRAGFHMRTISALSNRHTLPARAYLFQPNTVRRPMNSSITQREASY